MFDWHFPVGADHSEGTGRDEGKQQHHHFTSHGKGDQGPSIHSNAISKMRAHPMSGIWVEEESHTSWLHSPNLEIVAGEG